MPQAEIHTVWLMGQNIPLERFAAMFAPTSKHRICKVVRNREMLLGNIREVSGIIGLPLGRVDRTSDWLTKATISWMSSKGQGQVRVCEVSSQRMLR